MIPAVEFIKTFSKKHAPAEQTKPFQAVKRKLCRSYWYVHVVRLGSLPIKRNLWQKT